MPLWGDQAVTFIALEPGFTEMDVVVTANDRSLAYPMHRPVEQLPLLVVSLKPSVVGEGATYLLQDRSSDGTTRGQSVVDRYARSVTSRAGQPVADAAGPGRHNGRVQLIRDVAPSVGELRPRDLYVYLPPGYADQPDRRYPVLYMHDGQNCWDDPVHPFGHGGWREGEDLMLFEDVGAEHNERAWRARLHRPLQFFFGTSSPGK